MRFAVVLCLALGATPALAGPLARLLDQITPRDSLGTDLHDDTLARDVARHRLETDGYGEVSTLLRGRDGQLHGKAVKDGRILDVEVDRNGNVTAR
jgi:hypothetical protein